MIIMKIKTTITQYIVGAREVDFCASIILYAWFDVHREPRSCVGFLGSPYNHQTNNKVTWLCGFDCMSLCFNVFRCRGQLRVWSRRSHLVMGLRKKNMRFLHLSCFVELRFRYKKTFSAC